MEVRDEEVVEELTGGCGGSVRLKIRVLVGVGGRVGFGVQEVEGESVEVQEMPRCKEGLNESCTGMISHLYVSVRAGP